MVKTSETNIWEDLVVSMLSVNQYTLDYTYKSLECLREVGIFEPENLTHWSADVIENKLKQGGADRGSFMTKLFSERLHALGVLLSARGIQESEVVLSGNSRKDVEKLLLPVKGIGPKVLQNFFALRRMN